MTERVIDLLEGVEVEQHDGQFTPRIEDLFTGAEKRAAIGDAGQLVASTEAFETVRDIVERYEILDPRDFGLTRYISIAHKLTGWNAIKDRAEQLGLSLSDEQIKMVTTHVKEMADIKPIDLEDVDELLHRWANGSRDGSQ